MQLEAGKLCKTRNGRKVGIIGVDIWSVDSFSVCGNVIGVGIFTYTPEGRENSFKESPYDIVDEWTEPEKVPLWPEDFPPGSVILDTREQGHAWQMITAVYENSVEVASGIFGFSDLVLHWKVKRPGEDWRPCWREANDDRF